ncbi:MAG: hypothetical protein N4A35_02595 [Flavobacteriales bacterium]|jgi:hypothetical protein|nr:hypothetical protein [Flavobacteriales bacterium]
MKHFTLFTFLLIAPFLYGQNDTDAEGGNLFFGLNLGGFQSNNKTAVIYNGNVTTYGVNYFFQNQFIQPELDLYFKYDYRIESFADPSLMRYRPAFNIGGHGGIRLSENASIYADVNILKLNVEDFFTVAINNPNDPTVIGETYEQIPIFGEESRTNINLGIQSNFYNENGITAYFNLFGNVNNTRLEKNYFVINNKVYTIVHNAIANGSNNGQVNLQQTVPPGGVGYGGGAGLGAKYKFNEKITFDVNYYAIYTRTNMNVDLRPFGLNHALIARIIWG